MVQRALLWKGLRGADVIDQDYYQPSSNPLRMYNRFFLVLPCFKHLSTSFEQKYEKVCHTQKSIILPASPHYNKFCMIEIIKCYHAKLWHSNFRPHHFGNQGVKKKIVEWLLRQPDPNQSRNLSKLWKQSRTENLKGRKHYSKDTVTFLQHSQKMKNPFKQYFISCICHKQPLFDLSDKLQLRPTGGYYSLIIVI